MSLIIIIYKKYRYYAELYFLLYNFYNIKTLAVYHNVPVHRTGDFINIHYESLTSAICSATFVFKTEINPHAEGSAQH